MRVLARCQVLATVQAAPAGWRWPGRRIGGRVRRLEVAAALGPSEVSTRPSGAALVAPVHKRLKSPVN